MDFATALTGIASRAAEADQLGQLPAADVADLRACGYFAASVPATPGGGGASLPDCVTTQLQLAQASASTALVAAMPLHVFGHAHENALWPAAIAEQLYAEAARGGLFNSVASEPALGSPSRGGQFATTAHLTPHGYTLTGHKTWVTGGQHLTHLLVKAQTPAGPATFLVRGDAPGLQWVATWGRGLSLRASDSHDLHLHDAPADLHLKGERSPSPFNAWFPLLVGAVYLGAALAARQAIIRYALERVPSALGQPIAHLPGVQRQLGAIDVPLQAARALLLEVAREWHTGERAPSRVAAAKQFATETAAQAADLCLRLAGANGLNPNLPLERHLRDTRAGFMHPPAGDSALETIGKALLPTAH